MFKFIKTHKELTVLLVFVAFALVQGFIPVLDILALNIICGAIRFGMVFMFVGLLLLIRHSNDFKSTPEPVKPLFVITEEDKALIQLGHVSQSTMYKIKANERARMESNN